MFRVRTYESLFRRRRRHILEISVGGEDLLTALGKRGAIADGDRYVDEFRHSFDKKSFAAASRSK